MVSLSGDLSSSAGGLNYTAEISTRRGGLNSLYNPWLYNSECCDSSYLHSWSWDELNGRMDFQCGSISELRT